MSKNTKKKRKQMKNDRKDCYSSENTYPSSNSCDVTGSFMNGDNSVKAAFSSAAVKPQNTMQPY